MTGSPDVIISRSGSVRVMTTTEQSYTWSLNVCDIIVRVHDVTKDLGVLKSSKMTMSNKICKHVQDIYTASSKYHES